MFLIIVYPKILKKSIAMKETLKCLFMVSIIFGANSLLYSLTISNKTDILYLVVDFLFVEPPLRFLPKVRTPKISTTFYVVDCIKKGHHTVSFFVGGARRPILSPSSR